MTKKVGIPRGLFYYRYFPLWKTFFEELGAEIIVSDNTNKRILDEGVKSCVDEACLPVKIFHGHVLNLRDKVDYLFIPRLTSVSKNEYVCPKIGGLPDMVKNTLKGLPQIIDTEINMRRSRRNAWKHAEEIGYYFTQNRSRIREAYKKAQKEQKRFDSAVKDGNLPSDILNPSQTDKFSYSKIREIRKEIHGSKQKQAPMLNITIIGHPYNLYDSYINMNLIKKLEENFVNLTTVEMVDESIINEKSASLNKQMFWNFGRLAMGTILHVLERDDIAGVIYLMSFGCGIDSFVCDLIERRIKRQGKIPFIVLTLDEHSGEAGMNTRIEAFIDMIRWRKKDENNISAFR